MRGSDPRALALGWFGMLIPLLPLLAGCGVVQAHRPDPAENASALAEIARATDQKPQCLPLFGGNWPFEASQAYLRTDGVDALVAAGLFRREAAVDPTRTRLAVTPLGERHLRLVAAATRGLPPTPFLCFGRLRVVAVEVASSGGTTLAGTPDESRVFRWRYRIDAMPAWTRRPDVTAAYPFLARMGGRELASPDIATPTANGLRLSNPPGSEPPVGFEGASFTSCDVREGTGAPRCGR